MNLSFDRPRRAAVRRAFGAFAVVAALAASAPAQKVCMTAVLDGAQETPPTPTSGKGTGVVIVDRDANTLTYHLAFDGVATEIAAHIHGFSGPGVPSGIKFNLPLGKHKTGVIAYNEVDEANILAGLTYFNIHTTAFGGGEIRGQIVRSNAPVTMISLADGAQETPPVPGNGRGVGWFKFDTVANSIDYAFTYTLLGSPENAAHIHGFSAPGVPAGIKFNLGLGFHKTGVLNYPGGDEASYLNGLAYVNIHTNAFGGGEIRGQILAAATNPSTYCTSKVNSQGCSPAIASTGTPSLTGADDFHVTCSQVINNKSGLMYWGFNPKAAPFLGGTQCVASPTIRTPIQTSGGNAGPDDCSGTFDFHFSHAYMGTIPLSAGQAIFCEYWYRDPSASFTVGLSNGLAAEILP
jgi:hypothetical protein